MHPQATPTRLPRLGAPAPAALLLAQILPVLPPHRANHARRGPRFSVVAPCRRGGAPQRGCRVGDPGAPRPSRCDARLSPRAATGDIDDAALPSLVVIGSLCVYRNGLASAPSS